MFYSNFVEMNEWLNLYHIDLSGIIDGMPDSEKAENPTVDLDMTSQKGILKGMSMWDKTVLPRDANMLSIRGPTFFHILFARST
jgi:hypothetical protein